MFEHYIYLVKNINFIPNILTTSMTAVYYLPE